MAGHEDPWIAPEPLVVTEGFHARVYAVVCQVPPGRVTTYGDVATVLGSPRVARHVGWALAALPAERTDEVPWHRVINAKGMISFRGDTRRGEEQRRRLEAEGVAFDERGRVDLKRLRFGYDVLLGE
jgi:methylated-DNA-protein-cysteine methyltransferase-like protein